MGSRKGGKGTRFYVVIVYEVVCVCGNSACMACGVLSFVLSCGRWLSCHFVCVHRVFEVMHAIPAALFPHTKERIIASLYHTHKKKIARKEEKRR